MLTAVMDTIPELDEDFTVRLEAPIGGGIVNSSLSLSKVTILQNQDPYGVFEIITSNK